MSRGCHSSHRGQFSTYKRDAAMKNRKMLLPALLSIALVFNLILPASVMGASTTVPLPDDHSIIHSMVDGLSAALAMVLNTPRGYVTPMVAAGGAHTVELKDDDTVVAVGAEPELPTWNLGVIQYTLNISSTDLGWVTEPGVGTFTYDEGTVVDLVAEPYGYNLFFKWTGAVGTIADVEDATTTITMHGDYAITATFAFGDPVCFISTAAYGTSMAEEIQILRDFRDEYLLTSPLGQALVDLYYRGSPPMAEFITEHPSLKPIVRAGLLPAVVMSAVAINTTPAEKTAIVGLLVLVSVALAVWATKRRGRGPEYACG